MTAWKDLPEGVRAMASRAAMPDFPEWHRQMRAIGGCSHPIRLVGHRITIDSATGEVIDAYDTAAQPPGYLLTACGNRRASRCPACSEVYRSDMYQLVRAGLAGGKGVPEDIAEHPAVFATLTAPSFGVVHSRHQKTGRDGKPLHCRMRRKPDVCRHGREMACRKRHGDDDELVGQPLCSQCYDYEGAVLWNAHAGQLWHMFATYLDRHIARAAGLSRAALRRQARRSYVKVAEYQARGLVHFHAVIRLDGPDGPGSPPPTWGSGHLLTRTIKTAVAAVRLTVAAPNGQRELTFGDQLDIRPIAMDDDARKTGVTRRHVAGYIAKYATKGAEKAGALDRRIRSLGDLGRTNVSDHARRMIETCFDIAALPAYRDTSLADWAHMLGYRGHCATKSQRYATTLGALRQDRSDHRAAERRQLLGLPEPDAATTVTEAEWRYVGTGLRYGERPFAVAGPASHGNSRSASSADAENDRSSGEPV